MTSLRAGALAAASVACLFAAIGVRRPPPLVLPAIEMPWAGWASGLPRRLGSSSALRRIARPERLGALLAAAGRSRSLEEFLGEKALFAVLALGGTWAISGSVAIASASAFAAFVVPDLLLSRQARRRRTLADREIPVFLDLLAAMAAAGLSGQLAVRGAADATEGPLAEALAGMLRRVELGGRWRDEMLGLADRLELPDLRRAALVLARSDTMGSSFADALVEIADESREARRAAAAERARKAPVKMLFPLVFLVLPAFLLLTVVPVLVTTLRSIR